MDGCSRSINERISNMNKLTGTVRWFNRSSGKGMIREDITQKSYPVYACNIIGAKSMFEHLACVYLIEGQTIEFNLHEDLGAVNVSGGVFDTNEWERVKKGNHSFTLQNDGSFSSLFNNNSKIKG